MLVRSALPVRLYSSMLLHLASLVGGVRESLAVATAVAGQMHEYTHRLLGVALLTPDVVHATVHDAMQLLTRMQRYYVEYWSPRWEHIPEAKIQFATLTNSVRCIAEPPCIMHAKGDGN